LDRKSEGGGHLRRAGRKFADSPNAVQSVIRKFDSNSTRISAMRRIAPAREMNLGTAPSQAVPIASSPSANVRAFTAEKDFPTFCPGVTEM
jgi:hypothetical protein